MKPFVCGAFLNCGIFSPRVFCTKKRLTGRLSPDFYCTLMHKRWGVRRVFKGQKMYIYQLHNCSKTIETVPLLCGAVCASKWGMVFVDNGFGEFFSVPITQTVFSIVGAYAGEY